jgi:hypothetical protein
MLLAANFNELVHELHSVKPGGLLSHTFNVADFRSSVCGIFME